MKSEAIAELLSETEFAGDWAWQQLLTLSEYVSVQGIVQGDVLFKEGSQGDAL